MAARDNPWASRQPSSTDCPFCGGRDYGFVKLRLPSGDGDAVVYVVRCAQCGAQGPVSPDMAGANRLWFERAQAGQGGAR